ncbi:MAG: TetR/AcrR family transcriptional regulator [Lachnospiraceae bacterium]|nr:TetR/AcrR family transcriptional regulator [Lachnospiraceae bacterium]
MEEGKRYSEAEEKILHAALKVVNEVTINGTRMHLIAENAGMVQSNVHYYYKTKQQLMEELQNRILEEFYSHRRVDKKQNPDTLEGQLHVFFQQKKYMLQKKRDYDFGEMNFIIQSKIDEKIRKCFQESYTEWRDSIREIIIKFYPNIDEKNKENIPFLAVSLLEGASVQSLIDPDEFDIDDYFSTAEEMVLNHIYKSVEN